MSTDLILVLDVGNSGAKLGVVRGEDVAGPVRLPRCDGPAVREFAKPLVKDSKPLVAVCGSDSAKAKDLAWELGKVGPALARDTGDQRESLLAACVRSDVALFVGAPQGSST